MLATSAIAIFLIAWSAVFLVDYLLRISHFEPYLRLTSRFGIEISPFQVRFYLTAHHNYTDVHSEPLLKETGESDRSPKKSGQL